MRDIEGWVHRHFQDVRYYGGGTDLRVNCPFCWTRYGSQDDGHHLYISLSKETCHCFRCGYSAPWVRLVMNAAYQSYAEALSELYRAPKAVPVEELVSKVHGVSGREATYHPPFTLNNFTRLTTKEEPLPGAVWFARNYMLGRGIDQRVWYRYNLGVADNAPWRVVIPIEDDFWQARAIFPFIIPKYMSSKAEARHVLFNSSALVIYDEVVICEGAFSAAAVGENAVALLRKKATSEQLDRLAMSSVERFIVALDSDAKMEGVELARSLTRGGKDVTVWQYDAGDPADVGHYAAATYDLKVEAEVRLGMSKWKWGTMP